MFSDNADDSIKCKLKMTHQGAAASHQGRNLMSTITVLKIDQNNIRIRDFTSLSCSSSSNNYRCESISGWYLVRQWTAKAGEIGDCRTAEVVDVDQLRPRRDAASLDLIGSATDCYREHRDAGQPQRFQLRHHLFTQPVSTTAWRNNDYSLAGYVLVTWSIFGKTIIKYTNR